MKKLNNKGFALVETLIVTVFIMTIFTIIYVNFYPQIAEYEKREFYDDVDSKYDVYWFKRMIQNEKMITNSQWTTLKNSVISNGIYKLNFSTSTCSEIVSTYRNHCQQYVSKTGLKKLYLTYYHLGDFDDMDDTEQSLLPNPNNYKSLKDLISGDSPETFLNNYNIDEDLVNYLNFLPEYRYASLNEAQFRLIAEFERLYAGKTYKTFATIEVKR